MESLGDAKPIINFSAALRLSRNRDYRGREYTDPFLRRRLTVQCAQPQHGSRAAVCSASFRVYLHFVTDMLYSRRGGGRDFPINTATL
ncbi:hypothetical protein RRG08_020930 [Elysia crispata]|uniref:Uncharacterized protein n=1 Tax=Elysia crispata TaxID=231223 RepID=A0AAE1A9S1_9GAST|nr:hypothetical protein RRG08_020930 [Elysia crispata]